VFVRKEILHSLTGGQGWKNSPDRSGYTILGWALKRWQNGI